MSGGTSELNYDTESIFEDEHQGGNASATFINRDYHLDVLIKIGVAAENSTQGTSGNVTAVTDHEITVDNSVTWDNGDTCKIYKTANKGSLISHQWVDVSRGWKTPQKELIDGWREEDLDEDRDKVR